jgi:hypothetical protein
MDMNWPRYKSDEDARCHQCSRPLTKHKPSGMKPGNGARWGWCEACQSVTWYDLTPKED